MGSVHSSVKILANHRKDVQACYEEPPKATQRTLEQGPVLAKNKVYSQRDIEFILWRSLPDSNT